MHIRTDESSGNVLVFSISGKITQEQYDAARRQMEQAIAEHGDIRVLIDSTGWTGVEPSVIWEDLKFSARHLNDFERLAIIGSRAWQKWVAKAAGYLTKAEVRYFEPTQREEALAWVRT
jgi:hypothetical protein